MQDILELPALVEGLLLPTLEKTPARVLEDGLVALASQFAGLLGADLIDRFVQLGTDMEAVERSSRACAAGSTKGLSELGRLGPDTGRAWSVLHVWPDTVRHG